MRITGGDYRGRTIFSGKLKGVRPATDRVRETVFAILPQYIDFAETTVIDLYAGSGSLGFECLSRGAQFVTFVDSSGNAIAAIKKTADSLGCLDKCKLVKSTFERFLKTYSGKAGLLFADPPYAMKQVTELPATIARSSIAGENAVLVIEHLKQTQFPEDDSYSIFRQKIFGNTIVSFFYLNSSL